MNTLHQARTLTLVIVGIVLVMALGFGYRYMTMGNTADLGSVEPLTAEQEQKLAKSTGFDHVVAYFDDGFRPATLSIHAGETIRFTNGGSRSVWIVASDMADRADAPDVCADGTLNTCKPLDSQDFWEYTPTTTGVLRYVDKLDPSHEGVVVVVK